MSNRGRHKKKKYSLIKQVRWYEIPLFKRTDSVNDWLRSTRLHIDKWYKIYLDKVNTICRIEVVTENQTNI